MSALTGGEMNMERKSAKVIKPGKEKESIAKLPKVEKETLNSGTMMKISAKVIKPGKEKESIAKLPKVEKEMLNSGMHQLNVISVKVIKLTKS
jgi:hypothetical protein